MNEMLAAKTLAFSIGLIALWWMLSRIYREYCVDYFRQQMFVLRDNLFDEAAHGLVDFSSPAYGMLRSTMNGYLRYGHKMRLLQAIFILLAVRNSLPTSVTMFEQKLNEAVTSLPDLQRQRLTAYRNKMETLALKHIILGSPESIFILPFALLVLTGWSSAQWLRRAFNDNLRALLVQDMETTAYLIGQ